MKMNIERILIAVLTILLGICAWEWNSMAGNVQRNEDRSVENSKVIGEIRAYQEADRAQQDRQANAAEENNRLLGEIIRKMEARDAAANAGGNHR